MNNQDLIKKVFSGCVYFLFAMLFWPLKTPLLFAVLFGFALNPILKRLHNRFPKFKNKKTFTAVLLMFILSAFFTPITILIFKALSQLKQIETGDLSQLPIYKNIEAVVATVNVWLQSVSANIGIDLSSYIDLNVIFSKASQIVIPALTSVVTQLPTVIFEFLIFISSLYFILVKTEYFKKWFYQIGLFSEGQINQLSALLQRVCNLVLVSTVIVATAQALVVSMACLMAGYTDFIIIFMITFFMSFIPVIGSAPVSVVLIIFSFINSNVSAAVILLIAAAIAGSIDNVIKTYMLTGQGTSGVHPFVALLALIGSLGVFGFAGLFLGPIICELAFQIGDILFQYKKISPDLIED